MIRWVEVLLEGEGRMDGSEEGGDVFSGVGENDFGSSGLEKGCREVRKRELAEEGESWLGGTDVFVHEIGDAGRKEKRKKEGKRGRPVSSARINC